MKTFASLHYNGNSPGIKIEFERPPLKKFIHELYKCSARKLWQTAYLFRTQGVSTEQQARNRQEIEKYISDCMEQVIRSFLPWESITRSSFATEPSKNVVFNEKVEEAPAAEIPEYEPELEAELEEPEKLKITDESDNISIEDLDEKQEEVVDIDSKISEEGLVIKL